MFNSLPGIYHAITAPHRTHRPKTEPGRLDPFYGYGYDPNWPSILSIAHDESDGGRLFVITDRPCGLSNAGLPLQMSELAILDAAAILPVKFWVQMNGAVPAGATWHWTGNNSAIHDLRTGIGPNAGFGTCADVPGPYTPPAPANVTAATVMGGNAALTFDAPVVLSPPTPLPPPTPDDAITFDAQTANFLTQTDPFTLLFNLSTPVGSGSVWNITRQPSWIATVLAVPQNGLFA